MQTENESVLKECTKCKEVKPLCDFVPHYGKQAQNRKSSVKSWCKKCHSRASSQFKKDRIEKYRPLDTASNRIRQFKKKYGITPEDYDQMLEEQGHACALCKTTERTVINGRERMFAVDHDHETGRIRGLLCERCNRGLGLLRDNPQILRRAANYVENKPFDESPLTTHEGEGN